MAKVELSLEETRDLIWSPDDFLETVVGIIEFTKLEESQPSKWATFMFDSNSPLWGTREWQMAIGDRVPNGLALLILYRRGKTAWPFGIISLTNGAWTHAQPLHTRNFYVQSQRNRRFRVKVFAARLLWPLTFGAWQLLSALPLSLLKLYIDWGENFYAAVLQTFPAYSVITILCTLAVLLLSLIIRGLPAYLGLFFGMRSPRFDEQIEQTARRFMWRIAREAGRYQIDSPVTDSGRL